jgi:hypothetical protein
MRTAPDTALRTAVRTWREPSGQGRVTDSYFLSNLCSPDLILIVASTFGAARRRESAAKHVSLITPGS